MDLKGTCNNYVSGGYMLLEATGDSEADCKGEYAYESIHLADDVDDAQSCSYDDESETGNSTAELKWWESFNADDDIDEDEDEKKAGTVYGTSYCEDDEMQEQCLKSRVSDDSGVDEMEKNRLFWEACLAS